jgi:hypothetical protein
MPKLKYFMYATTQNGDGHSEKIGESCDITDFSIRIGMFADDVQITFDTEQEPEDET